MDTNQTGDKTMPVIKNDGSYLTEDEFNQTYEPYMHEKSGTLKRYKEAEIKDIAPSPHLWTMVHSYETGNMYILPGFHTVNREFYVVTRHPWTDPEIEVLWWDNEEFNKEFIDHQKTPLPLGPPKIKPIKLDQNHDALQRAVDLVNGKAKAHTFSVDEIFQLVERFDRELDRLNIPKTKRQGAKLFARSGEKLARAYVHSRKVNDVVIERRSSSFYLVGLSCATAWQEAGSFKLYLTEAQDQIAKKTVITWRLCA